MLTAVREWIARHRLPAAGDRVLAACSGGADSLALVHVLNELKEEYGFSLAVAHVNHLLRGEESDADAVFVREFAAKLGLPFYVTEADAAGLAAAEGRSLEDAAREVRYRFLRATAAELGGALIATGHHRDDQAETVLLNLFRGAGGAGLGGMKPVAGGVIRPLLAVAREEIGAYCRECGLTPRTDSSNFSTEYLRNFLRLELMPRLAAAFNANIAATLCRTAELVGDEHDYVVAAAVAAWPEVVDDGGDDPAVDCRALGALHVAVRRELLRLAVVKKRGDLKGISFFHVEKLLELASSGVTGNAVELPGGVTARRVYGRLIFAAASPPPATVIGPPGLVVAVPGTTPVPALGVTVTARLSAERPAGGGPDRAVFAWEELAPPIRVRSRQAGDRFRPGGKKVKEYLIDAKVPRQLRDTIPVFTDGRGVIWLGGVRQAKRCRPGNPTGFYLELIIEKTGGLT
ncbi:tRNA lysidine(34) synthetase TilS [Anaeroselena agilis]|uniref:tRNA(Ile)-lysidine synthase n=1 Tax=Anaeroselena agilis TaxID=3063788 RepID=A0ABU3P177_9FIRM|nr:tRNA lysidine(34) synthetase TilS [Selenomonadales bacterium 4137-cl]